MQGQLKIKSKVIQTMRPKSQVFRRRIKPERASTPQRWSRRIRSLPPIPINVLKPRRKMRRSSTSNKHEQCTSTTFLNNVTNNHIQYKLHRGRKKSIFVNKSVPPADKSDSVEVVRIVPVVVYVKNPKQNKTFIPEEIRVHINDNPTCQMVSQAINSHIHKKIKRRKLNLKKSSKKFRVTPNDSYIESEVQAQVLKKKYPSRKKLLLYQ